MSAVDFDAFASFVAEELAIRLDRIHPASRLEEDLECTGDDSDLFLQIYANRFDVDLSALWFSDHFHSEAGNPGLSFPFWFWLWTKLQPNILKQFEQAKPWRRPLTIGHLHNCAVHGVFTHPGPHPPVKTSTARLRWIVIASSGLYVAALSLALTIAIGLFTALAASIPQEAMSHDKDLRSLLVLAMLPGVLWLALYNGMSTSREYVRDRIARCAEAAGAGMSPAPAESD
jgi:hypothetical protein